MVGALPGASKVFVEVFISHNSMSVKVKKSLSNDKGSCDTGGGYMPKCVYSCYRYGEGVS